MSDRRGPDHVRRVVALLALVALAGGCRLTDAFLAGCGVHDVYRRQASNSVMAVAMFESLFEALGIYADRCGGYPESLAPLEEPSAGKPRSCDCLGALADAVRSEGMHEEGDELGMFEFSVGRLKRLRETGIHHEYRHRYVARDPLPNGLFASFTLAADPVEREVTGFVSFWMSEQGAIHENRESKAGPDDEVLRVLSRRKRQPPSQGKAPAGQTAPPH